VNTTKGPNSEPPRSSASQIYVQGIDQAASIFDPLAEQMRSLQRLASASLAGSFEYASSFFDLLALQSRMMRQMTGTFSNEQSFPQVEVYEKQGGYVIEARVPGFKREDIDIACRPNRITISGSAERKAVEDELKGSIYYSEFQRRFSRTINLPSEVDTDTVSAKLQDGLLTITLQPLKESAAKRVVVTV
ncbi:MAG: Hsp20/alpha crystallin family protein, partial [Vulcanimicrobiaceae bacterium]